MIRESVESGFGKWTLIRRIRKRITNNKIHLKNKLHNQHVINLNQSLYKPLIASSLFILSPIRDLRDKACPSRDAYAIRDIEFLGYGEGYTPTPRQIEVKEIEDVLDKFVKHINRAHFFKPKLDALILEEEDNNEFQYKKSKIWVESNWTPPTIDPSTSDCLNTLIQNMKRVILSRPVTKKTDPILSKSKALLDRPDCKLVMSDKNMGFVLLSTTDYYRLASLTLSDNRVYYKWPKKDHLAVQTEYTKRVEQFLIDFKNSFDNDEKRFLQGHSTIIKAKFHILPKIHKDIPMPNIPLRPITGIRPSAFTSKLSSILTERLLPRMLNLESCLLNSLTVIQKLEGIKLEEDEFLFSIDFESLYTSIRLDDLYEYLDKHAHLLKVDIEAIKFIFKNNNFIFGKDIFKQIDGIAMGTNVAPVLANIYLEHKFDVFVRAICNFSKYYCRFIDDCFGIHKGTLVDFENIIGDLNMIIAPMRITYVIDFNTIDFLDLTIFRGKDSKIQFKTFQKSLNRYSYIPNNSYCPTQQKKGWILGELIRYVRTNTSVKDYELIRELFWHRLIRRGYTNEYLIPLFNDKRTIHNRNILTGLPEKKSKDARPRVVLPIRYTVDTRLDTELRRLLLQFNVANTFVDTQLVYKANPTLQTLTTRSGLTRNQVQFLRHQDTD